MVDGNDCRMMEYNVQPSLEHGRKQPELLTDQNEGQHTGESESMSTSVPHLNPFAPKN